MKRWRIKAVAPEDGVTFLDWMTDAPDSQAGLKKFLEMIDGTIGPEFHLDGDWDIQIREVEIVIRTFPRAVG